LRAEAGTFLDLCYHPKRAAEVTLQPIRRFGMDGAILFSDILLIPQAMGQKLWFEPNGGPKLAAIRSRGEAEALSVEPVEAALAPVYAAIREVTAQLPDRTTLIGFAGAPWTVATYMVEGGSSREFAEVQAWAEREPGGFDRMMEKLVTATAQHLSAQISAGVEVVQLFDTWAGIVADRDFDRLVIEPTRRIVEKVKHDHPDVPVIGFPRGIGSRYRRYFAETGIDALSIDTNIDPEAAASELQPLGAIQGNLDPRVLVAGGAALDEAVIKILDALGKGPFVFNLGHGVVPETPVEHVARVAELIRDYG
jgi:uroporphyrinogen decarboxylase